MVHINILYNTQNQCRFLAFLHIMKYERNTGPFVRVSDSHLPIFNIVITTGKAVLSQLLLLCNNNIEIFLVCLSFA